MPRISHATLAVIATFAASAANAVDLPSFDTPVFDNSKGHEPMVLPVFPDEETFPEDETNPAVVDGDNRNVRYAVAYAAAYDETVDTLASLEERAFNVGNGPWAEISGGSSRIANAESERYGARLGAQFACNDLTFGGVLTATNGHADGSDLSRSDWDSYGIGVFAGRVIADFVEVGGTASYARHNFSGLSDLDVFAGSVFGAVELSRYADFSFIPYAGVRVISMHGDDDSATAWQAPLGVSTVLGFDAGDWKIVSKLNAALAVGFGDDSVSFASGRSEVFAGSYAFEGGVSIEARSENLLLGASYEGAVGNDGYRSNKFLIKGGYAF